MQNFSELLANRQRHVGRDILMRIFKTAEKFTYYFGLTDQPGCETSSKIWWNDLRLKCDIVIWNACRFCNLCFAICLFADYNEIRWQAYVYINIGFKTELNASR